MKESKQNSILFFASAALATIYTIYSIYQQRLSSKSISILLDDADYSTTTSTFLSVNRSHYNPPLVYISTREGLTSRFRQLEIIYSNAQLFKRNITLINMPSVHYKQLGPINLCKLFVLPPSIKCLSISPEQLTHSLNCSQPCSPDNVDARWLYKPHNFGIRSFDHLLPSSTFSWNTTSCALLWGFYFELQSSYSFTSIRFQNKYIRLFLSGLRQLRLSDSIAVKSSGSDSGSGKIRDLSLESVSRNSTSSVPATTASTVVVGNRPLWVFHWRRGDQADRCRRNEDTSVNCLQASALVDLIVATIANYTTESLTHHNHTIITTTTTSNNSNRISVPSKSITSTAFDTQEPVVRSLPVLVYIATNEVDPISLRTLRAAGFKIFDDLGLKKHNQLNALERFCVEVQMMAHADRFFGFGSSGVQTFVHRMRNERIVLL